MTMRSSKDEILAPFCSSEMEIKPQWIDFNGHLNVAYYVVLFDRGMDELYDVIGLGLNYLKKRQHSTMTAEMHVRYLREVKEGDSLQVRCHLLAYDSKRIHLFEELTHATEGWVSATCETMTLHVDMTTRKVAPWPDSVLNTLELLKIAHAHLLAPEGVGRSVAMPKQLTVSNVLN